MEAFRASRRVQRRVQRRVRSARKDLWNVRKEMRGRKKEGGSVREGDFYTQPLDQVAFNTNVVNVKGSLCSMLRVPQGPFVTTHGH